MTSDGGVDEVSGRRRRAQRVRRRVRTWAGLRAANSLRSLGTTSSPRRSSCSSTVLSGSPAWSIRNRLALVVAHVVPELSVFSMTCCGEPTVSGVCEVNSSSEGPWP